MKIRHVSPSYTVSTGLYIFMTKSSAWLAPCTIQHALAHLYSHSPGPQSPASKPHANTLHAWSQNLSANQELAQPWLQKDTPPRPPKPPPNCHACPAPPTAPPGTPPPKRLLPAPPERSKHSKISEKLSLTKPTKNIMLHGTQLWTEDLIKNTRAHRDNLHHPSHRQNYCRPCRNSRLWSRSLGTPQHS